VKGVILAGGTATRLGALSVGTNKHLLPLGREPMVCRSIRTLLEAGIEEAVVVVGVQHFGAFVRLLGDGGGLGMRRLQLACQERPGGIAQALLAAEAHAGGRVVVLLADNVWERSLRPWVEAFGRQESGARALLKATADIATLRASGVPELDATTRIGRVEEKPPVPASPYVVTGAYAFDETVWSVLPGLAPSARGELEITDVLNRYAERGLLEHDVIDGFWTDAGQSIEAYYRASDWVRRQEARS